MLNIKYSTVHCLLSKANSVEMNPFKFLMMGLRAAPFRSHLGLCSYLVPVAICIFALNASLHTALQAQVNRESRNLKKIKKPSTSLEEEIIQYLDYDKTRELSAFLQSDLSKRLFEAKQLQKKGSLLSGLRAIARAAEEFGSSSASNNSKASFIDKNTTFIFRSENLWDCLFLKGRFYKAEAVAEIKEQKFNNVENQLPTTYYEDVLLLYNPENRKNIPVINDALEFATFPYSQNSNYFSSGDINGSLENFREDSVWHESNSIHAKIGPDFITPNLLIPSQLSPNITLFAGYLYSTKWWDSPDTDALDYSFKGAALVEFLHKNLHWNPPNSSNITQILGEFGVAAKLSIEDFNILVDKRDGSSKREINYHILNNEWHFGEMYKTYRSDFSNTSRSYLIGPLFLDPEQIRRVRETLETNNVQYLKQFSKSFKNYFGKIDQSLIRASADKKATLNVFEKSIRKRITEYQKVIDQSFADLNFTSGKRKGPIIKGLYLGQSMPDVRDALTKLGIESEISYSKNLQLADITNDLIENYILENDLSFSLKENESFIQKTHSVLEELGLKPPSFYRCSIPDIKSKILLGSKIASERGGSVLNLFGKRNKMEFDDNGRLVHLVLGPNALQELFNVTPDMDLQFIAQQFVDNIPELENLEPFFKSETNSFLNNSSLQSGYKLNSKKGFIFSLSEVTQIGTGIFDGKGYYLDLKKVKKLNFD